MKNNSQVNICVGFNSPSQEMKAKKINGENSQLKSKFKCFFNMVLMTSFEGVGNKQGTVKSFKTDSLFENLCLPCLRRDESKKRPFLGLRRSIVMFAMMESARIWGFPSRITFKAIEAVT
jgi:hypothetical protein